MHSYDVEAGGLGELAEDSGEEYDEEGEDVSGRKGGAVVGNGHARSGSGGVGNSHTQPPPRRAQTRPLESHGPVELVQLGEAKPTR